MKLIFKMYREIHSLDKRVLPMTLLHALASSFRPFINIYFSARLITLLTENADFKSLAVTVAVGVSLNLVLFFMESFLSDYNENLKTLLLKKENKKAASILFKTDYEKLENSEFKELLHKHEEAEKSRWSRFPYFVWTTFRFLCGIFTLIISAVMIYPLIKIGFTATGNGFFEKPIFLITIILSIVIMAVIILLTAVNINKSYLSANESYAELDRIFYCFLDIFGNYSTGKDIRLYNEQNLIYSAATDRILTDGEKLLRKISAHTAKSSSFVAVLGALVGFGVYMFIGVKGLFGLFPISSLVLYCGAFMQIVNGVMMTANTLGKLAEIIPLAKCYFEIIETGGGMEYGEKELSGDSFEIEFKDVSFKYPESESYALKHINLTVHNGEHIAVVGRNGSGKTTFIKLMCRLYDATEGEILINGVNIKEYSKSSLAALYAVVFQDFKLFAEPVYRNVAANGEYDREKLYDCLEQSDIKDRILGMCDKENTYLYKNLDRNGVEISGGEAQKLALARALYKDSPVVVLDEPTAALDPVAENEIYTRFNSFVENKTAVYISHRLSSCVFCDRIAVFDNSELAEIGTHEELLASHGKYSGLWTAQAQYYV